MIRRPTLRYRQIATWCLLGVCTLGLRLARGASDTESGTPGAAGANGTATEVHNANGTVSYVLTPGGPGGGGGTANVAIDENDQDNEASATGGAGGAGGSGAAGGLQVSAGGNGGVGGNASATAQQITHQAIATGTTQDNSVAVGGAGGNGGSGGSVRLGPTGSGGAGGNGGNATAGATAFLSFAGGIGDVYGLATARATGGAGGNGGSAGGAGGNGGVASLAQLVAQCLGGGSATAIGYVYGGAGGNGSGSGAGGSGANESLTNAAAPSGYYADAEQYVTGGNGGGSNGGTPGIPGTANSVLNLTQNSNGSLTGISGAFGGAGGDCQNINAAPGAAATASSTITGDSNTEELLAQAIVNDPTIDSQSSRGGNVTGGTGNAGNGGAGNATISLTATDSPTLYGSGIASAFGGNGGSVLNSATGNGGAGGAATAGGTVIGTDAGELSLAVQAIGGNGGQGQGAGFSGGTGGAPSLSFINTTQTASTAFVVETALLMGGSGGNGVNGANGGNGANISLSAGSLNLNSTGEVRLELEADGGSAGGSDSALAGLAGNATSSFIVDEDRQATFQADCYSSAGNGGDTQDSVAGAGGSSSATINVTSIGELDIASYAGAGTLNPNLAQLPGHGNGGSITGGAGGNAGAGGPAIASAIGVSTDNDANANGQASGGNGGNVISTVSGNGGAGGAGTAITNASGGGSGAVNGTEAQSIVTGGNGGQGSGAGFAAGDGGSATARATAAAATDSASAYASAQGGAAGAAVIGAAAGLAGPAVAQATAHSSAAQLTAQVVSRVPAGAAAGLAQSVVTLNNSEGAYVIAGLPSSLVAGILTAPVLPSDVTSRWADTPDVQTAMASNPANAAALAQTALQTPNAAAGVAVYNASFDIDQANAQVTANGLMVGMLPSQLIGAGLQPGDTLRFRILRNGTVLYDQLFTDNASLSAELQNTVFLLGPANADLNGSDLDIQFLLDLTSAHPAAGAALQFVTATTAPAQAGVWNNPAGGSWAFPTNWSANALPIGPGTSVTFGSAIGAPQTVTLNQNTTVGSITFSNATAYTIAPGAGGPSLTLDNAGAPAAITVTAGDHALLAPLIVAAPGLVVSVSAGNVLTLSGHITGAAPLTLNGPGKALLAPSSGTAVLSALTLNSAAQLDLTNNAVVLDAPDAGTKAADLTALAAAIETGRDNGAWNGPGIISSTVAAHPAQLGLAIADNALLGYTSFAGENVNDNSILIAPALLGDATLDGTVDLNDLNTVLNHLGQTSASWTTGNFDNAATIDLNDLNDVLNNLGETYTAPSFSIQNSTFSIPNTPAPEPASLLLAALAVLPLLSRRRSR